MSTSPATPDLRELITSHARALRMAAAMSTSEGHARRCRMLAGEWERLANRLEQILLDAGEDMSTWPVLATETPAEVVAT